MDLTSDQHRRITAFIQDWSRDKTMELETTFGGKKGVVDSSTFLQIAQRLRAKGFEMMPQDDRLSILTPNELRISLQGLGVIQLYCKDDSLQNKTYTVMAKSRTSPDSNIDLRDYDVRFKMRRETDMSHDDPLVTPILSNWTNQKKAFRLIRRWSFRGKGIRFDLSMVRQSPTLPTGEFRWATRFLQQNILTEPPRYEVEVELLHDEKDTATPDLAYSSLIRGVGEVLRAIQKNSLLIRVSVADKVRAEYAKMIGTMRFRGVGPVTLEVKNMKKEAEDNVPNVRTGYNVTDKADGLRALGYVNPEGELFLLDQSMNVYRTGMRNPACANSLVDGEWVTLTSDEKPISHYLLFDIYHSHNGHTAWDLPFATFKEQMLDTETPSRFNKLKEWYQKWTAGIEYTSKSVQAGNRLLIALKRFEFATPDSDVIFRRSCSAILDASRIYHTDGLILTSNSQPLPGKAGGRFIHQFKWKPAKDNTVDFLIKYERNSELPIDKITTTIGPTNDVIQYKTMHLYVGGTAGSNPRDTILNQLEINKDGPGAYQAVLFTPLEFSDTMANTCYIPVTQDAQTLEFYSSTEDSEEPISDNSVVEMRYDSTREPGWRWVPSRIRHDKTERLLRAIEAAKATGKSIVYSGVMNDEAVANSVWSSIHEPITLSMIRSGNEQPNEEEMLSILNMRGSEITKTYYQRNAPKENLALVSGLQEFHNKYIKDTILLKTALRTGKNIIDVACGKGGDMWKWINNGARYVIGIDYAGENITNPKDGAYRRYLEAKQKVHHMPNIAFVIGNSSRRIVNGEAGASRQESDILRSVFGKENPQGSLPSYIERVMAGSFLGGADIAACMFALHYFFETPATLDGFLTNLSETVKPNGLFIGCCFDGDNVFKLLRGRDIHESIVRTENDATIWSITKEYEQNEFLADESSIGMAIDVEFISIGSKYREYLVSFPYLIERLAKIGFRLLNEKELAELNLKQSTSTFDVSHAMASAQRMNYRMLDSVKEFSFLNRWFIFKRQGGVEAVAPPIELLEPQVQDALEEAAVLDDEKVEVEVEVEAPSGFRLPPRDKMWEAQQVFAFGMDAVRKDILRVVDPKGKPDANIGRWMSLTAPFPIPDPMPNLDDPSATPLPDGAILYPSAEHYIAGMKLKHGLMVPRRPGEPDLGQLIMSMDGDIHQKSEKKRREAMQAKKFLPESDDDYKLLVKEAQEVRKFFTTRKQMNQYKADISDDKWLPIRDKYLHDALRYRFKFDARFHAAVTAAKNDKKYLLHTKTSTNSNINEASDAVEGSASELYGKRDVSRKIILGKNKVGLMLMEIAGFQF